MRDGAENFSIRRVANECSFSIAGLYRHFSNRDELLLYASIQSMQEYFEKLGEVDKLKGNSLIKYFKTEQLFAKYTFEEPEIFNNLYFGVSAEQFDKALFDSFNLFDKSPEEYFKNQFGKSFVKGGIEGRNLAMLEICFDDGFFNVKKEDLPYINIALVNMYRGFLNSAMMLKQMNVDRLDITERYLETHKRLISLILK